MTKFFRIFFWEFKLRFRSKSFLFTTIFTPLLLASLIYIPSAQLDSEQNFRVGIIDASEDSLYQLIQKQVSSDKNPIILEEIRADNAESYRYLKKKEEDFKSQLDSVNRVYFWVKNKRTSLFLAHQRTKDKKLKKELVRLYDIQSSSRDLKDSLEYVLKNLNKDILASFVAEAKNNANHALNSDSLDAYVYLERDILNTGKVEYHSLRPGHFTIKEKLQVIISNQIFQNRLLKSKLNSEQTQEVLEPIEFSSFQLSKDKSLSNQNFASYYGPVLAVMLMFISIFTSVGSVFSSLVTEKNNRILEFVLSTSSKSQMYFGKIVSLCCIGLLQLSIWISVLLILFQFDAFALQKIPYLTWENLLYYYIYYILGYFMFATFLAGFSVIYMSEQESHNLNQFIRIAAIFPLIFALLVLENPNSETVRLLSFIPFLTPSFMVMRIPLSTIPPIGDIQISILILLLSTVIIYLISFRLFRVFSNFYGKRPSIAEIAVVLWRGRV